MKSRQSFLNYSRVNTEGGINIYNRGHHKIYIYDSRKSDPMYRSSLLNVMGPFKVCP